MTERHDLRPIAEGGLLDRRLFLSRSLGLLSSFALAPELQAQTATHASPWLQHPGASLSNYGQPSPHEQATIRWTMGNSMAPGNGVSWTPLHQLEGMITPSALHFERHHNGVPAIDPAQHKLLIHGLVNKSLVFSMQDLQRYPMQSIYVFIECGGNSNAAWRSEPVQTPVGYFHGMASCSEWTGIPVKYLLNEAHIKGPAKWVIAEGSDAALMNISLPLEKIMQDCILALYQNGERIRPENGYPLRLIVPGWEGVLNVKWLRRLHVAAQPSMTRNETAKYTELLPSGKARQFSFVMLAKSIITQPSVGFRLHEHGIYQISGLAWSGRGKIARVEVSADGGKTWADAELQTPVLSKCFTRFRMPWLWQGQEVVLQSRATDETGYVQPSRSELLAQQGDQAYFHYNAIVSWEVTHEGEIRHVYV